jgi:hypothetical protein
MYNNVKVLMNFAVALVFCIFFSTVAKGQEKGGMGYSMFGNATINIDDLNAELASKGYAKLSDSFFSVGGGGHGIVNSKWIIGGEGHTLLGDASTSDGYKSSINITYAFFDVGYIAYAIKDLRFYPLLGIGAAGMNFNIVQDLESLSLGELLDNPNRGMSMSTGGFLLNLSLGIDYLLVFGQDETGRGGIHLGVRAGYTLSPFKSSWMMDDLEIAGAPETGITGPYVRVMFGGGGIGNKE